MSTPCCVAFECCVVAFRLFLNFAAAECGGAPQPGQRYLVRKGKGAAGDEVRPIKLKRGRPSISRGHEVHILKLEGINNPEEVKYLPKPLPVLLPEHEPPRA